MELHDGTRTMAGAPTGETRRLLALLQERLDETGGDDLKLEPGDVGRLGLEAGIEGEDVADALRVAVRSNLVRLRGRWREGRSAVRAPVYIEGLTERGLRELAATQPLRSGERTEGR